MKVKLDENLGALVVRRFQAAAHDVATVRMQGLSGASDQQIYDACRDEARLLVTLDLDFANPFRFDPALTAGIAVIRVPTLPGLADLEAGVQLLLAELDAAPIDGRLWIVGRDRVREYAPERRDLADYFDATRYEVVMFASSTTQTTQAAADRLGLADDQRSGEGGYAPHRVLKGDKPVIYASTDDDVWISFDVVRHAATAYQDHPNFDPSTPAVLLWRRDR